MNSPASIQISFTLAEYEGKKKMTRREVFLAKMEQVHCVVPADASYRALLTQER